jgi:hypothetical protein
VSGTLFNDDATGAVFSPCRRYRYRLWRHWGSGPTMAVIGLNPSTADETKNDPTITRIIGFAKREGCGRLEMLNLFAWRSPYPEDLYKPADPVGPDNDDAILGTCMTAEVVVGAWGAEKIAKARAEHVRAMLADAELEVRCFGTTLSGAPRHPLYLRADTPLVVL